MKRYTSFKFIRLTDEMKWKCEMAAVNSQCSFGEWARKAFVEKLKLDAKQGRKARH